MAQGEVGQIGAEASYLGVFVSLTHIIGSRLKFGPIFD
jgi:hypothetical protein